MGKWRPFCHVLLLAIYPVLFLIADLAERVDPAAGARMLLVTLPLAGLLLLLLKRVCRDWARAALLTSCSLFLIFSYGYLVNPLLKLLRLDRYQLLPHLVPLLFCVGLFLLLQHTFRSAAEVQKLTTLALLIAVVLVGFSGVRLGLFAFRHRPLWVAWRTLQDRPLPAALGREAGSRPDIYYLIFDRYARADILQRDFGYDNSTLLDFLRKKGFYVASRSVANYQNTVQSCASSLNGRHLEPFTRGNRFRRLGDVRPLYRMIQDNLLFRFFRNQGYRLHFFGTWWPPTSSIRHAHHTYNYFPIKDFADAFFKSTILFPLACGLGVYNDHYFQYRRELEKFRQLEAVVEKPGPKLVFAHFLLPHDPYVFDKHGRFVDDKKTGYRDERDAYVQQLMFANRMLTRLLDRLFISGRTPPVVVLQADEGPPPIGMPVRNWHGASPQLITGKFAILNAVHFPNRNYRLCSPTMTPVNTIAILLNSCFGTALTLLPDRSYSSRSHKLPYDFMEVTRMLQTSRR